MKCPHCSSDMEYTRKMYWTKRIGGRIKCIACGSDFKIIVSFRYYAYFILWFITTLGIGLINRLIFSEAEYEHISLLVLLFIAAMIWVFLDRKFLNKSKTVVLS